MDRLKSIVRVFRGVAGHAGSGGSFLLAIFSLRAGWLNVLPASLSYCGTNEHSSLETTFESRLLCQRAMARPN